MIIAIQISEAAHDTYTTTWESFSCYTTIWESILPPPLEEVNSYKGMEWKKIKTEVSIQYLEWDTYYTFTCTTTKTKKHTFRIEKKSAHYPG